MTKRYIINTNGEIENTSNHMTWDSFTEILIILNGQSRHLEELADENEQLKQRINSRLHFYRELYEETNDNIVKRIVEDLEDILW